MVGRMSLPDSLWSDAVVMVSSALVGGLLLDLRRRLPAKVQIIGGAAFLTVGWIVMLAMAPGGPLPHRGGAAAGFGLFLTGVALLALPAFQAIRRRDGGGRRR